MYNIFFINITITPYIIGFFFLSLPNSSSHLRTGHVHDHRHCGHGCQYRKRGLPVHASLPRLRCGHLPEPSAKSAPKEASPPSPTTRRSRPAKAAAGKAARGVARTDLRECLGAYGKSRLLYLISAVFISFSVRQCTNQNVNIYKLVYLHDGK